MIEPNTSNSNSQLLATQKSPSNTKLNHHTTLTLTTNSFYSSLSLQNQTKIKISFFYLHLDYLRISSSNLTKKSFDNLLANLGLPIPCFENKISWHPDPKMPKSKKYQNRIVYKKRIVLGYTKRLLSKSKVPKYVYDIMADFTGTYFADLTLIEQLNLVCHLNSNYQIKCHRLDVAIDDYSRKLFPVGQMITAYLEDNHFGFQVIDDSYIDIINNQLVGTLGIGSRYSSLFIRIYTLHKYFVRWETELKKNKAQKLFDELAMLATGNSDDSLLTKDIHQVLLSAALDYIDFRNRSIFSNKAYATKSKTIRLNFWQELREELFLLVENQTISNYQKIG